MIKTLNFQIDLTPQEIDLFKSIFRCNDPELEDKLSKIGKAALIEYSKMITGEKVFTRGKDIQEYRLLNLIKYYFDGQIPSEQQISALFQITLTESRGLVRSITSKYQYELSAIIQTSLKDKLDNDAKKNGDDDFRIALNSAFYKDEFNKILSENPLLGLIEKDTKTSATYIIKNSAYAHLCSHFGINATTRVYP